MMSPNRKEKKKYGQAEHKYDLLLQSNRSMSDRLMCQGKKLAKQQDFINQLRLCMGAFGGLIVLFCCFYDAIAYILTHHTAFSVRAAEGIGMGQIMGGLVGGLLVLFAVHRYE